MVWQNRVQHLHAAGRNQPQPNGVPPYNQSSQRHFISIPTHPFHDGNPAVSRKFSGRFQSGSQPFAFWTPSLILAVVLSLVRPKVCYEYGYYGLNKCGESSDPPSYPSHLYLSLEKLLSTVISLLFFSPVEVQIFLLITLHRETISVCEMSGLLSLPAYVFSFFLRWFFSVFSSWWLSSFW